MYVLFTIILCIDDRTVLKMLLKMFCGYEMFTWLARNEKALPRLIWRFTCQPCFVETPVINGHFRYLNWRYLPQI